MTARYGNVTHIVRVLDQHDPLICLHVVGHWVSPVRVFLESTVPGRRRCATLGSVAIVTVPGARRLNVAFPDTATRMAAPTSRGHPTTAVADKFPGRQARYRKFATLKSGDGIDRQDILSAFGLLTAGATVVGHVMDRFTPMSDRCDLANRVVSVSVIRALMAETSSSS